MGGYGQPSKPAPDAEHRVYCDRAMSNDIVALMNRPGHEGFAVVGHDRGSYVAYRAARDYPEPVHHGHHTRHRNRRHDQRHRTHHRRNLAAIELLAQPG